jgi:hypothetical protein
MGKRFEIVSSGALFFLAEISTRLREVLTSVGSF